jgi:hypothetical protein
MTVGEKIYSFSRKKLTSGVQIGRSANNDIVIEDVSISRSHAIITLVDGKLLIQDMKSRNGISINDKKITDQAEVAAKDTVKIGSVALIIKTPEQIATAAGKVGEKSQKQPAQKPVGLFGGLRNLLKGQTATAAFAFPLLAAVPGAAAAVGVVGIYVTRSYFEVLNRPRGLVSRTVNLEDSLR